MTLKELIERVRANVHDNDVLEYTDETLIGYINDGIRFVRRTVLDVDAMLLVDSPYEGQTEPAQNIIEIPEKVSSVIDVRIDGQSIPAINARAIPDTNQKGAPKHYFVTGFRNIHLWPVPQDSVEYCIYAIPDIEILRLPEDEFPLTNELEDFVIEYAGIRASISNEFEVSQETSIMSSIVSQLESMIRGYNCRGVQSIGYWDGQGTRIRDYGRRYW